MNTILNDWMDENGITCVEELSGIKDKNGVPYTTLLIGEKEGKDEGERIGMWFTFCGDELWWKFIAELSEFLGERKFIVWRMRPEILVKVIEEADAGEMWWFYQIQCRLTAYQDEGEYNATYN